MPETQESLLSRVCRDLELKDIRYIEWADVRGIEKIPQKECVITRIFRKYGNQLRDQVSKGENLEIWKVAVRLTEQMLAQKMPPHLRVKVEYFHWMRQVFQRSGEPKSLKQILLPGMPDDSMMSYNRVPLRFSEGILYLLKVPSEVTENV